MDAPSEPELFRRSLEAHLQSVHTAIPGIVVSYNPATQTANVRPAIKRLVPTAAEGEFTAEALPVIPAVPVLWPRAGASWFAPVLEAGDGVLLIMCETDPNTYLRTGEVSEPGDVRRHSLAHAVAIPGLFPRANALPAPSPLGEGAALASKLDLLIGILKTVVPGAGSDTAAKVLAAFPNVTGSGSFVGTTTASRVLKLEE